MKKKGLLQAWPIIFSVWITLGCGNKQESEKVAEVRDTSFATTLILPSHLNQEKEEKEKKFSRQTSELKGDSTQPNIVRGIKVRNIGPLGKVFNDSNFLQLESAKRLGIEPFDELSSFYFTKRPIVKISDTEYYKLDTLTHSIPYLVPEAADLLAEIGKNFIDSLEKRGGDSHIIKVTSLLRTPESVKKLRRRNINATDSSTHQYGTTFDISYTKFYCLDTLRRINEGNLKNLLAEVLNDLRESGKCYVKYERKTGCFHVTVRDE